MITLLVLAVLGALLILVLRKLYAKPAIRAVTPPPRPLDQPAELKVRDARAGDFLSVSGAGDQFNDLDCKVESRSEYDLGPRRWIELRGTYQGRRVMVFITIEDEMEVSLVSDARRLTLEELALTENDLGALDSRQNASDYFEFEGKNWHYRFSREFKPARMGEGSGFYGWVFREAGANRTMLVRKAEGEPFGAVVAVAINPADVTVFRP